MVTPAMVAKSDQKYVLTTFILYPNDIQIPKLNLRCMFSLGLFFVGGAFVILGLVIYKPPNQLFFTHPQTWHY